MYKHFRFLLCRVIRNSFSKANILYVDFTTEDGIWNNEDGIWNDEDGIWNNEDGIWNNEDGIWNNETSFVLTILRKKTWLR